MEKTTPLHKSNAGLELYKVDGTFIISYTAPLGGQQFLARGETKREVCNEAMNYITSLREGIKNIQYEIYIEKKHKKKE